MSSNEWLPAQIPFDLVRRGFAPDQVTAHLERLEYDLRIATANGDATNQRLSEVSAQLHNAQAEADELRTQLDNLAREPVSMTGLSNRMQRMIRLAEEEAAEIRARANAEADKVTGSAAAACGGDGRRTGGLRRRAGADPPAARRPGRGTCWPRRPPRPRPPGRGGRSRNRRRPWPPPPPRPSGC